MINRRTFCMSAAGLAIPRTFQPGKAFDVAAFDRKRVLSAAEKYLGEKPVTITESTSERSAGGKHDFFSEGDYWWPDPKNPQGPYIQRDGMSNPGNFIDHRRLLMRLSLQVPALVAAWKLAGNQRYATHAATHLQAWFVDPDTRMNPSLQYAQAIQGRVTGRGTGIIDTIHFVEVARAIELLPQMDDVKTWFARYLAWMTTHPYGIEERDTKNNHATCWVMQVAAFARLTANAALMQFAQERFKTILVPTQIAADGSFPLEIARTKPYGYSLFNLDAMATICQILDGPANHLRQGSGGREAGHDDPSSARGGSSAGDRLWTFELPDGRGMRKALGFMAPFIE